MSIMFELSFIRLMDISNARLTVFVSITVCPIQGRLNGDYSIILPHTFCTVILEPCKQHLCLHCHQDNNLTASENLCLPNAFLASKSSFHPLGSIEGFLKVLFVHQLNSSLKIYLLYARMDFFIAMTMYLVFMCKVPCLF